MFDFNLLNENQRQAVTCGYGPTLVVAGAGTGKTRVLTSRIIYLIQEKNINPRSILALTFTNKAANEMKKRIDDSLKNSNLNWIGTYSSICLRILKEEIIHLNRSPRFVVIDDDDQLSLIKEIVKNNNIESKILNAKKIRSLISKFKCMGYKDLKNISYDKLRDESLYASSDINLFTKIFSLYHAKLLENNLVDFDDLLLLTLEIFDNNPEIVKKWQQNFEYILVDEFQDTNKIQFDILMHLVNANHNIFVVGDPDQTIYTWRGAYPLIFNDFLLKFKDAKKYVLNLNYRSGQKILDAANKLIKNNGNRLEKNLKSQTGEGNHVLLYDAYDVNDEGDFISKEINYLHEKEGYEYKDFAILYRANYLSRSIETKLIDRGVPYLLYGGVKFYQRKEIKDILSYLRLLVNDDEISFKRIINVPKRGIGQTLIDRVSLYATQNNISFVNALYLKKSQDFDITWNSDKVIPFINEIENIRNQVKGLPLTSVINKIIELTNYKEYLQSYDEEFEQRWENVIELLNSINLINEMANEELTIEGYLDKISTYTTSADQDNKNTVTLMTIHAAKGLEFKVVFIIGMNEGVLPSTRLLNPNDLEEERRIAYVALTRAEKLLYITIPSGYNCVLNSDLRPSRFIKEIVGEHSTKAKHRMTTISDLQQNWFDTKQPSFEDNYNDEPASIEIGDTIIHTIFGEGIVVSKSDEMIDVVFKKTGMKTINSRHKSIKRKI